MRSAFIAPTLAIIGLHASVSQACEPPPPNAVAAPSQAEIDAGASRTFADADYIAEVVVLRSPRFQRIGERRPPPAGVLRVIAVIKGSPPETLLLPLADPCLAFFQKIGERLVVSSYRVGSQPQPIADIAVQSLRRRKIGKWENVR
jgi:hypothetical protein